MAVFEIVLLIIVSIVLLISIWNMVEISTLKTIVKTDGKQPDTEMVKLQLQAYERLTILSERISLQNLLSRVPNNGLSSREMQISLIENIKQEYEYNVSQQIYIRPEIWRAVDNMKEQNIYIINQLAANLPPQASAMDLNKQIVDFLIKNPKTLVHDVVHEAINSEAKKLM